MPLLADKPRFPHGLKPILRRRARPLSDSDEVSGITLLGVPIEGIFTNAGPSLLLGARFHYSFLSVAGGSFVPTGDGLLGCSLG
jgi:hypothetical protein